MLAVTIVLGGAMPLIMMMSVLFEILLGPKLNAPLIRRRFYFRSFGTLFGVVFAILLAYTFLFRSLIHFAPDWHLGGMSISIAAGVFSTYVFWRAKLRIRNSR